MTLEELTAKLEAIDKELLPLFEKKGRTAEECRRVAELEAEYSKASVELRAASRAATRAQQGG